MAAHHHHIDLGTGMAWDEVIEGEELVQLERQRAAAAGRREERDRRARALERVQLAALSDPVLSDLLTALGVARA